MRNRRKVFDAVDGEMDGERAQRTVDELTRFYRSPGSAGYHRATNLIEEMVESFGMSSVVREVYPLDGRTVYAERTTPLAWEPIGAELTMVTPHVRHLVSYDEAPSCIAWWSGSTPPEGRQYEVVDVGTGESDDDYLGKDVEDKVVFIRDTGRRETWDHASRLASKHGVAGIINDYLLDHIPPWRTPENVPEGVQLQRLRVERPEVWALSINHHASQKLSAALQDGPVKVYARVQTRTFEGEGVNLTATIEGTDLPEESVYFVSHTTTGTKPGANCAAGAALAVEVARTLQSLIDSGKLPRPRRSIKFLWNIEGMGSHFLFDQHPREVEGIMAGFNYCSPGHDQHKLYSSLMFYRVPDSVPSYLNDFCSDLIEEAPKEASWVFKPDREIPLVRLKEMPYTPWSDNHGWNEKGIPTVLLMSWPDLYFHTQLLTADCTDPAVMKRAGLVSAVPAYELANADASSAEEILLRLRGRSLYRINRMVPNLVKQLSDLEATGEESQIDPYAACKRVARDMEYLGKRDLQAAEELRRLVAKEPEDIRQRLEAGIADFREELEKATTSELERVESYRNSLPAPSGVEEDTPSDRVPQKVPGSTGPGLVECSHERRIEMAAEIAETDPNVTFETLRPVGDELWFLIDGKRTLGDIRDAICYEFDVEIPRAYIDELVGQLVDGGRVTWRQ
ncbi:MAG: M28 family peptidase [Clostridia bacterium]